ncbi:MAG: hypothetical protein QM770_08285 [Tepidisphaeraceae bacterium]
MALLVHVIEHVDAVVRAHRLEKAGRLGRLHLFEHVGGLLRIELGDDDGGGFRVEVLGNVGRPFRRKPGQSLGRLGRGEVLDLLRHLRIGRRGKIVEVNALRVRLRHRAIPSLLCAIIVGEHTSPNHQCPMNKPEEFVARISRALSGHWGLVIGHSPPGS